jgi:hypothetical protein
VLAHKLREAMAQEMKGHRLGGKGEVVEIDGGYFGGYVKPANRKENRRDRRRAENQSASASAWWWCAARRPDPAGGVRLEAAAVSFIKAASRPRRRYTPTKRRLGRAARPYVVKRINHQVAYSEDGTHTNGAESFFSRMRAARSGTTTTSPAPTSPATRRRPAGARTAAATRTARRSGAWWGWPSVRRRPWTSAATGSGRRGPR